MTAGSFGRKGMAQGAVAAPSRRAAFGARNPDHFEAAEIDEAALRRAAFLAGERAREDPPAGPAAPAAPIAPTDRSLKTAYILWFATGLAGGHRFYLRRPLTGALQAMTFAAGWGAAIAEYYAGFGLVGLSCLWLLADGLLIARLHRTAGAR
jgi:TM2 domain-containing membrane protein YozV